MSVQNNLCPNCGGELQESINSYNIYDIIKDDNGFITKELRNTILNDDTSIIECRDCEFSLDSGSELYEELVSL